MSFRRALASCVWGGEDSTSCGDKEIGVCARNNGKPQEGFDEIVTECELHFKKIILVIV